MNDLNELELLNMLETSSLEPHEDYTIEFSNGQQKLLNDYIKRLQQELLKEKEQNKFLMERDNKLQEIEQVFMNESVDLEKLSRLVRKH